MAHQGAYPKAMPRPLSLETTSNRVENLSVAIASLAADWRASESSMKVLRRGTDNRFTNAEDRLKQLENHQKVQAEQIFALDFHPIQDVVAAGLINGSIEL